MALSNMIKEPRRELSETFFGILIAAPFVAVDYYFGRWFQSLFSAADKDIINSLILLCGMVVGAVVIGLGFLVLVIVHELGEDFCNAMQKRDIHLRPRQRR